MLNMKRIEGSVIPFEFINNIHEEYENLLVKGLILKKKNLLH